MTDGQIKPLLAAFDKADAAKTGTIDQQKFTDLFPQVTRKDDPELAELYFKGIDVHNTGAVRKDEFKQFAIGMLVKDQPFALRLLFCGLDTLRSSKLGAEDIKTIAHYIGQPGITDDAISEVVEKTTGQADGVMSYAQIARLLLDVEVPAEADPYDGRLNPANSSKCCLLL